MPKAFIVLLARARQYERDCGTPVAGCGRSLRHESEAAWTWTAGTFASREDSGRAPGLSGLHKVTRQRRGHLPHGSPAHEAPASARASTALITATLVALAVALLPSFWPSFWLSFWPSFWPAARA